LIQEKGSINHLSKWYFPLPVICQSGGDQVENVRTIFLEIIQNRGGIVNDFDRLEDWGFLGERSSLSAFISAMIGLEWAKIARKYPG
jgi:hypothetical protein